MGEIMGIVCNNCEYFFPFSIFNNEIGECRKEDQIPLPHQKNSQKSDFPINWPQVDYQAWCGDFKRKQKGGA